MNAMSQFNQIPSVRIVSRRMFPGCSVVFLCLGLFCSQLHAGGVTIIVHGWNSGPDKWVNTMANRIMELGGKLWRLSF